MFYLFAEDERTILLKASHWFMSSLTLYSFLSQLIFTARPLNFTYRLPTIRMLGHIRRNSNWCIVDNFMHRRICKKKFIQNATTIWNNSLSMISSRTTSGKLAEDSSISCRHSFCYLGWPCNCLGCMQNFVLYRSMTDSRRAVGQKLGVWAEKPCKIHDFHSNPCTHSLENLCWPSKLHRSTQNFMLYPLMADSRGVVGQKLGVSAEKPYKIHDFHSNPCRHSLENLG